MVSCNVCCGRKTQESKLNFKATPSGVPLHPGFNSVIHLAGCCSVTCVSSSFEPMNVPSGFDPGNCGSPALNSVAHSATYRAPGFELATCGPSGFDLATHGSSGFELGICGSPSFDFPNLWAPGFEPATCGPSCFDQGDCRSPGFDSTTCEPSGFEPVTTLTSNLVPVGHRFEAEGPVGR